MNGEEVAIKLESVRARHPQLEYEARVYKSLAGGGKRKENPLPFSLTLCSVVFGSVY